jgi:hypothetical protein
VRANGILCTHNGTGGSGDLTLAASQGFATFGTIIGSNVRWMEYEVNEYTDSTRTTLLQAERGFAKVDNTGASPVLKRSTGIVLQTLSGGAENDVNPTALTIGNTAANVVITCAPSAATMLPALPFVYAGSPSVSGLDGVGATGEVGGLATGTNINFSSGVPWYVHQSIAHAQVIKSISVRLATAMSAAPASASLDIAIYEIDSTGLPGKKIAQCTQLSGTTIFSSAGTVTLSLSSAIWLPPGDYIIAILPQWSGGTGTPAVRAVTVSGPTCFGTAWGSTGGPCGMVQISGGSQTTLNDPATAPTGVPANPHNIPALAYRPT